VKQDGIALMFVKDEAMRRTEYIKLCLEALKSNNEAIEEVSEKVVELLAVMVEKLEDYESLGEYEEVAWKLGKLEILEDELPE
jgi:hypothetical protein